MAEAVGGDVVEADLDDELGPQRLPFAAALGAPAAGAAGGVAGETGAPRSASSFFVRAGRSASVMVEVKPTWSSLPASS